MKKALLDVIDLIDKRGESDASSIKWKICIVEEHQRPTQPIFDCNFIAFIKPLIDSLRSKITKKKNPSHLQLSNGIRKSICYRIPIDAFKTKFDFVSESTRYFLSNKIEILKYWCGDDITDVCMHNLCCHSI